MSDNWIIQKRIDPLNKIWPLIMIQIFMLWGAIGALGLGFLHVWPIIFIPHEIDIFNTGTFTITEYLLMILLGIVVSFYEEWEILGY